MQDDPFDAALADLQRFIAIDIDGDGKPDALVPRNYGITQPEPSLDPAPGGGATLSSANTPMGDAVAQRLGPGVGPAVSGAERFAGGVVKSTGVPAMTDPNSTPGQVVRGAADAIGTFTPVGNALAAYDAGSAAVDAGRAGDWSGAAVNAGLGAAALGGGYLLNRALKGGRGGQQNALSGEAGPAPTGPLDARIGREVAEQKQGQFIADRYETPVPLNSLYKEAAPASRPNMLYSPDALSARGPGPKVGGIDDPQFDWVGQRGRPLRTEAMINSLPGSVDEAAAVKGRQLLEDRRKRDLARPQTEDDALRMRDIERRPAVEVDQAIDADIARTVGGLREPNLPRQMGEGRPTVEMIQEIAARHQIPVDDVVERLRRQGFEFGASKTPYTGRNERGRVEALDWNTVNALARRPGAIPFE